MAGAGGSISTPRAAYSCCRDRGSRLDLTEFEAAALELLTAGGLDPPDGGRRPGKVPPAAGIRRPAASAARHPSPRRLCRPRHPPPGRLCRPAASVARPPPARPPGRLCRPPASVARPPPARPPRRLCRPPASVARPPPPGRAPAPRPPPAGPSVRHRWRDVVVRPSDRATSPLLCCRYHNGSGAAMLSILGE